MSKQLPNELLYTKQHEWLEVNGNHATLGITDHAQELLGDIVFVELPEVNSTHNASDSLGVIESTKAASDFYAPITGTITEVNHELESNPEIINQEPYQQGWLCKIQINNSSKLDQLLTAEQYQDLIKD
jgi:glycine cleavage system H protein